MAPRKRKNIWQLEGPERLEQVCAAIRLGAPMRTAARYAGLSPSLLYKWMADHPEVAEEIEAAEAEQQLAQLRRIEKAAEEGVWTASAWLLERRWPESYGRRARDEGEKKAEVRIILQRMDDPQDRQRAPLPAPGAVIDGEAEAVDG